MVFEIDERVADLLVSGGATDQDTAGLDYLALGVAEGNHRLAGKRRVLRELATLTQGRTRRVLERAVSRVAQEGALHQRLTVCGRVVTDVSMLPVSDNIGKQRVITFPLRWFDSSQKVQPTAMLTENLLDARVMFKVGEVGAILAGWGYLPLSHSPSHGGGSTIAQVLQQFSLSNRLCLCVVDSDRACPTSALAGTAATVQPFKNPAVFPLIEVFETAGRELENTLPDIFYNMAYGAHNRYGTMAIIFGHLTQQGEIELRAHIDVKAGVTGRQILNHPAGSAERAFWESKLQIILNHLGITAAALPCLAAGTCMQPGGAACTCTVIPGIPLNALQQFLNYFEKQGRYYLKSQLDNSVRSEWLRLGSNIASWCCGDDRLRL